MKNSHYLYIRFLPLFEDSKPRKFIEILIYCGIST